MNIARKSNARRMSFIRSNSLTNSQSLPRGRAWYRVLQATEQAQTELKE
jgi:hypothetical protein